MLTLTDAISKVSVEQKFFFVFFLFSLLLHKNIEANGECKKHIEENGEEKEDADEQIKNQPNEKKWRKNKRLLLLKIDREPMQHIKT